MKGGDWLSVLYSLASGGGLTPSADARQRAAHARQQLEEDRETLASVLSVLSSVIGPTDVVPGGGVIDAARTWIENGYGRLSRSSLARFIRENPLVAIGAGADVLPGVGKVAKAGILPLAASPAVAARIQKLFGTTFPGWLPFLRYQPRNQAVFSSVPSRGAVFGTWSRTREGRDIAARSLMPRHLLENPDVIPIDEKVFIVNPLILDDDAAGRALYKLHPDIRRNIFGRVIGYHISPGEIAELPKTLKKGEIPNYTSFYGNIPKQTPKRDIKWYGRSLQKALNNREATEILLEDSDTYSALEHINRLIVRDVMLKDAMQRYGIDAVISVGKPDPDFGIPLAAEVALLPNRVDAGWIIRDPDFDMRKVDAARFMRRLAENVKKMRRR